MTVTERIIARLIQPLLKAQWEKGFEEGIQQSIDEGFEIGKKRSSEAWQEWIRRQIEAGTQFRDDIPPPDP